MIALIRRRPRAIGAATAAAALVLSLGCGKHKESLVVVSLTTATPTSSSSQVTLTVSQTSLCPTPPCADSLSQTFTVSSLTPTPTSLGVYLPESVTGPISIVAQVDAQSCAGYDGTASATIAAPGASVGAAITLAPALRCNCREFDHRDSTAPACVLTPTPAVGDAYITNTAFSPDGRFFVTAGDDGRAKIWRFDGTTLTPEGHVIPVDGGGRVAFSPDGKLMAAVSWSAPANPVVLYDVPGWTIHQTLTGAVDYTIDVAFTPDNQHVVVLESDNQGSGSIASFSLISGNINTGSIGDLDPVQLAVSKVAGAGIPIAVAGYDGRAGVLTYSTGGFSVPTILQVTSGSTFIAWTVAFSPDGSLLAAGGEDATFNLWASPFTSAAPTGPALMIAGGSGVNMLAFSPDSQFVGVAAGSIGREVSFWNVGSRAKLASYQPSYGASAIAYSPDGLSVAGGELYCGMVFLCTPPPY